MNVCDGEKRCARVVMREVFRQLRCFVVVAIRANTRPARYWDLSGPNVSPYTCVKCTRKPQLSQHTARVCQ